MLHISMPHFGETNFYDTTENAQSRTLIIQEAEASLFERYCAIFEEKGGKLLEQYTTAANRFAAIFDGKDAVFINYFRHTKELQKTIKKPIILKGDEKMKGLDIYTHEEEGYKAKLDFESWRIAFINYSERFDRNNLKEVQRHLLTDEAFILLKGEGGLFIGEAAEEVVMEPHKIYNVTKGTWHHTWVSKDGQILIVENSNTSKDNSETKEVKR